MLVTYPNEVALGGAPRVQFEYEEDHFAVDTIDRVLKQTLGGTNNTQVPAGGTMTYVYEAIPVVNTANLNAPVSRTTATDRSGNVTEYQFNCLGNVVRIREFTNKDLRASEPEFYETSNRFNADGKLVADGLLAGQLHRRAEHRPNVAGQPAGDRADTRPE